MTVAVATAPPASAADLPGDVRRLLEARLPAAVGAVRWQARSGTRIDTGSWLRRAPLHAVVHGDRLALVAAGPRPYVLDLPVAALSRAVYNHVTGELAFRRTAADPAVPPLRLDPLVARSLLAFAPPPAPPSGTPSHA